ncbi:hypothetical protein [Deinococcus maricopensis]|uniref:Uncharacterized protein n=1 Tax=Deinococcus maricopensis (strain DSM 21211 / LMG 22137 / NRRL B-23946 / LB-34) TaxID=709986 RepID=E8U710_DEIML|nr:hypothetical protein [Deinococcus maricopensis]ADV66849.1 hypothetical protein Deima_1198 [Deinococcus maricopensis DSM 21211]
MKAAVFRSWWKSWWKVLWPGFASWHFLIPALPTLVRARVVEGRCWLR